MFFIVQGIRKSAVEAKLLKDGKSLGVKEVEIIVQEDKVIMKLKKTVRSSSGPYQIKLSNAQGETNKDVIFNIQGKVLTTTLIEHPLFNCCRNYFCDFSLTDVPSAPEDISVHDIFQDSCVLKWKKPKDDGGMPIVNYIIERQDLSVKG